MVIIIVIINNIIPIVTAIKELALCFTTSDVLSQLNFGYLRLIIIPIKCDTKGIIIDSMINSNDSIIFILNLTIKTKLPINNIGVVIVNAANTLLIKIVFVFIGNDFNILIFFPSKLITELVIDVMNDVNDIKMNINIDKLLFINSFVSPRPVCSFVSMGIMLSNLIDIIMVAMINNTKANPALIINTGILKNVFSSFFINEIVFGLDFIFRLSIFTLLSLVVVIIFSLEFILK